MKSTKIEKYCQFCCHQDFDMDYEPCWYGEKINYCPICGRKLKEDENAERQRKNRGFTKKIIRIRIKQSGSNWMPCLLQKSNKKNKRFCGEK